MPYNTPTFGEDGEREGLSGRRAVPPVLECGREGRRRGDGGQRVASLCAGGGRPRPHQLLVLRLQPLVVPRRLVGRHGEPVRSPHGSVEAVELGPRRVDVDAAVDAAPHRHVDDPGRVEGEGLGEHPLCLALDQLRAPDDVLTADQRRVLDHHRHDEVYGSTAGDDHFDVRGRHLVDDAGVADESAVNATQPGRRRLVLFLLNLRHKHVTIGVSDIRLQSSRRCGYVGKSMTRGAYLSSLHDLIRISCPRFLARLRFNVLETLTGLNQMTDVIIKVCVY